MDKIRAAAIVVLGMGEKCAADILKNMTHDELELILDQINKIDSLNEMDVIEALNEFFVHANSIEAIDGVSKDYIINVLMDAAGDSRVGDLSTSSQSWLTLTKTEPLSHLAEMIQNEHPQVIAALVMILSKNNSSKAADLVKQFSHEKQQNIVQRMTAMKPISSFGMRAIADYFENELKQKERYNIINVDGVDALANIIVNMEAEAEEKIISEIDDKNIAEKVQEKIFPFERLTKIDKKGLQALMQEVNNEELALALKGVDSKVKSAIFAAMSSKSVEILKDDMEAKGPVKLADVITAQKNIIALAKKMATEGQIILQDGPNSDVVY